MENKKRLGPKYRTCQGCFSRPSDGVAMFDDGSSVHVCNRCIPTNSQFVVYEPTVRAIVDEELELDGKDFQ